MTSRNAGAIVEMPAEHVAKPGLEGSPKLRDYSTTKGPVHAFTRALAQNVLPVTGSVGAE